MARYVSDKRFESDMAELEAYRSTGLSPKEVCALMVRDADPAPLPLPLHDDDSFSCAAGILEDDEFIEVTYASLDRERWEK